MVTKKDMYIQIAFCPFYKLLPHSIQSIQCQLLLKAHMINTVCGAHVYEKRGTGTTTTNRRHDLQVQLSIVGTAVGLLIVGSTINHGCVSLNWWIHKCRFSNLVNLEMHQ